MRCGGCVASFPRSTSTIATSIFSRAIVLAFLVCGSPVAAADAPQGFGADTPGGERQPVYRVRNLDDSGPGSLRDAVSKGRSKVVFDVAGTIKLEKEISVRGSYVTIDGFSAPSPGITVRGAGIRVDGKYHDVIIRGIRIRDPMRDGITIKNGARNVLVHNVSVNGCGDGSIDIGRGVRDVTIAWNVLSGCAKNMLIGHESKRLTLHHNVFVHSQWRNPWAKNDDEGRAADGTTIDMRNNLIWGWGNKGGGTGITCGAKANVVKNFYSSPNTAPKRQRNALMVEPCAGGGDGGRAYADGNVSADDLPFDINRAGNVKRPYGATTIETTDACVAAHDALAIAGAEPLDSIDQKHLSSIELPECDQAAESVGAPSGGGGRGCAIAPGGSGSVVEAWPMIALGALLAMRRRRHLAANQLLACVGRAAR